MTGQGRFDTKVAAALVKRAREGDAQSLRDLFALAYPDLLGYAARTMAAQRASHTLDAAGLVHEAFVKIERSTNRDWNDYGHFLRVAFCAMRQHLIDHAVGKAADKRGGDWNRVRITGIELRFEHQSCDLEALHVALDKLRELDPDVVVVIELKFYAGYTMVEIAEHTGRGLRSVERDWQLGRTWLHAELSP